MACHKISEIIFDKCYITMEDTRRVRRRNIKIMDPYNKICVSCGEKVMTDCRHCHNFDCYECFPQHFCEVCDELKVEKVGYTIQHNINLSPEVEKEINGMYNSCIKYKCKEYFTLSMKYTLKRFLFYTLKIIRHRHFTIILLSIHFNFKFICMLFYRIAPGPHTSMRSSYTYI